MATSLNALIPELQPYARTLVDAAGAAGLQPRITSTRRSNAEQTRLYRRFLAGQQPYPVARPGTSAHEYGWAFDLVVSPLSSLAEVGAYWESLGGIWGGHPSRAGSGYDPVHFEYPGFQAALAGSVPDQRQQQEERHFLLESAEYSKYVDYLLDVTSFFPGPIGTASMLEQLRHAAFDR